MDGPGALYSDRPEKVFLYVHWWNLTEINAFLDCQKLSIIQLKILIKFQYIIILNIVIGTASPECLCFM